MPVSVNLTWRSGISAALLIVAIACATVPASRQSGDARPPGRALLHVTNKSVDDLQLFLMRSGTAIRVGRLPGLSTRVFELSGSQLGDGGEIQLVAGSRSNPSAHRSSVFAASFGHRIAWVIDYRVPSDVVIVR